ncbi:MAG: ACP S-malonyltransferase [Deltaproteobacteria bacterium]|nr:ACP S-malonyltransferase [Deltaproteobacteria bacterium]
MSILAVLFPGQGSQYVGMGQALYEVDYEARRLWAHAEAITHLPLARLCFEGLMAELTETVNLQPAVTVVNLALYNALSRAGIRPHFVIGHSLGEYSALYAAGVLSEDDTLKAVQKRGQVMHREAQRHPGAMAAILRLSRERLQELLAPLQAEGVLALANFNTPEQIVISGEASLVNKAIDLAKKAGGRGIPLKVSGAWHSALMSEAQPDFAAFLDRLTFNPPTVPMLFNVTGQPETDPACIRDYMARQLTSPVLWTDCVAYLLAAGVDTWVEVGPKDVLKGLVTKTLPPDTPYKFYNIEDPASLERFLTEFSP